MSDTYEIVGVDVGNGYTKTAHAEFISAVKDFGKSKPAITDKMVCYEGHYYTVGGKRSKTKTDQKEDNTAFILALAALGEEFKYRNISPKNVVLSEGLPIERCIEFNKEIDKEYYKKGQLVNFEYEDVPYSIFISDVFVNPQCASGIADLIPVLPEICHVIDVGSWTVDILPVIDHRPVSAEVKSLNNGVITCMLACNEEIRRLTGKEVMEEQIQKIMRGQKGILPDKYENCIRDSIRKYVNNLYNVLIENEITVDTAPCVFIGGGATVIETYGKELFPIAQYYTDIHRNAIGYEKIAAIQMKRRR